MNVDKVTHAIPSTLHQIAPSAEPASLPHKLPKPSLIPTPNRQERKLAFGIDCAEHVHFTHWYGFWCLSIDLL